MISFTGGVLQFTSLKNVYQEGLIQNVLHEAKNRNIKPLFIVDLYDHSDDDTFLYSDVNILSYPKRNYMHVSGLYRGCRAHCKSMEPDVFVNNLLRDSVIKILYVFDERFKEIKLMVEFIIQIYPSFFRRPLQRSHQLCSRLREAKLDRVKILQAKKFNGFARMMENTKQMIL